MIGSTHWLTLRLILWAVTAIAPYECYRGAADEVRHLPGLDFALPFRHYSGYLNATDDRFLHYWFFESQSRPQTDPLVLWLNGGPGCSSVLGALTEQGPLHVAQDGTHLYANPYAWNREANILFLEAPAGVGFSYKTDGKYATNDTQVAADNYAALQSFYRKFPHLKPNDLYVTGESYGGVYVPTLAVHILRASEATGADAMNLKGFAVGNGYLSQQLLGNSLLYFAYNHGLYDTPVWTQLWDACCPLSNGSRVSVDNSTGRCDFVGNGSTPCQSAIARATGFISEPGLNIYNLYADCQRPKHDLKTTGALNTTGKYSRESFDRQLMYRTLNMSAEGQVGDGVGVTPPCIDASYVEHWINQPDVRTALHIPEPVGDWTSCSVAVMAGYTNIYKSVREQVLELLGSHRHLKGMVYNGDVDMACNFLGDEWFVEDLALPLIKDYNVWYNDNQVAGFYKVYDRLAFVTVRGSGHMVPTDKAGAALLMFNTFLKSGQKSLNFNE